jgi:hypothetical protein
MRPLLLYAFLSLFAMACAQAQRLPGNALVEGVPLRELTDLDDRHRVGDADTPHTSAEIQLGQRSLVRWSLHPSRDTDGRCLRKAIAGGDGSFQSRLGVEP